MQSIVINGKEYNLKKIDFNAICELEELGVDFNNIQKQTFKGIRALTAFVMDENVDVAGQAIEAHIGNGGSIADFAVLIEMLAKSDFFQKSAKTAQ